MTSLHPFLGGRGACDRASRHAFCFAASGLSAALTVSAETALDISNARTAHKSRRDPAEGASRMAFIVLSFDHTVFRTRSVCTEHCAELETYLRQMWSKPSG